MSERPIRVLLGKLGLDGHDRGVKVLAKGLRDHGMEVIYLGMRLTPEQIATVAVQEDVDVIGISLLSGAHMRLMPALMEEIRRREISDVLVVLGGTIPESDEPALHQMGVHGVFRLGAEIDDIAAFIRENVPRKVG
ncbi:MAG: cobalamin B12-binding domain-containing protein [Firmicutes bacterium]|nr:cobalamin B12-binding domain-containing protein [Bacillota bacterium]